MPVCQLVENFCSRHILPALLIELPEQVKHRCRFRLLCCCRLQEVLNEWRPERGGVTEYTHLVLSVLMFSTLLDLTESSLSVSCWVTSHW